MSQWPGQHVEQKYLFSALHRDAILSWLEHACLPDARFPRATVSSIYFDTPSLAMYGEKRNGDFRRCKIRLRWYDDGAGSTQDDGERGPGTPAKCFFEAKRREGSVSRKIRVEQPLPEGLMDGDPFAEPALARFAARAGELGYSPPGLLVPVLLVRYQRRRFVDPRSFARVAVDTGIRCTHANSAFVPGSPPVHLEAGLLEVKGRGAALPSALTPLGSLLGRCSFSKYAACLEGLLIEPARRK